MAVTPRDYPAFLDSPRARRRHLTYGRTLVQTLCGRSFMHSIVHYPAENDGEICKRRKAVAYRDGWMDFAPYA